MNHLVAEVVRVLDEGNPFMNHNGVLRKHLRQQSPPPRKRVVPRSPSTTGEREVSSKSKEKQRKEVKDGLRNTSLKWDGQRWKIRARQKEQIEKSYSLGSIQEISLRTGAIAVYLTKVKQYANKVDGGVNKLKSLSSKLQNASDEKERNRIQGEIVRTDADVLSSLRKMQMYGSLVSASGGLGADRSYKILKKMEKQKRK